MKLEKLTAAARTALDVGWAIDVLHPLAQRASAVAGADAPHW